MSMIPKHDELEALTEEELVRRYNAAAYNTVVGTGFYRDEIVRRQNARQTDEMLKINRNVHHMTIAIRVLTVVNVLMVGVTLYVQSAS